ncbi:MAG: hypothetical protein HC923_09880 [Myxococcales bacterium]|nr:hypothetical protein [Myxococcales bacterium]
MLEAARMIIPGEGLADVIAIDAGSGRTPELDARVCAAIEEVDEVAGSDRRRPDGLEPVHVRHP